MSADGSVAVVAADSEVVDVFVASGGQWSHQTALTADDGSANNFGVSVSVGRDGSTVLIGAHRDSNSNGDNAGAAYLFERAGDTWSQRAKLTAADSSPGYALGVSVSLSGDGTTALVGADGAAIPYNDNHSGSAHVFEPDSGNWTQRAKLTVENSVYFGGNVSLSDDGTTAIVGDYQAQRESGNAHTFRRTGDDWRVESELQPDSIDSSTDEDSFGDSVSLSADGSTALVGALADENENGVSTGTAYLFDRADGEWPLRTKLTADDGKLKDVFGDTVALSAEGTVAAVGAPYNEDPPDGNRGSVYVFTANNGAWQQRDKLTGESKSAVSSFGSSVAVADDGSPVLVGAPNFYGDKGGAYVFE